LTDPATPHTHTLSLHDALPIYGALRRLRQSRPRQGMVRRRRHRAGGILKAPRIIPAPVRDAQARASDPKASTFVSANAGSGKTRSEEHTSELQSPCNLVCRLLL